MDFKKLKYTDGCVCTSLDVDGREFNIDLSGEERKALCHQLIDKLGENDTPLQQLFIYFMEQEGEFEDLGRCDDCGDSVYRYTYEM